MKQARGGRKGAARYCVSYGGASQTGWHGHAPLRDHVPRTTPNASLPSGHATARDHATPQRLTQYSARGFTLVELLLVMGIIVMLVGLLFPAVNAAVTAVRVAATQATINNLSAALEAFKQDWGIYPPSMSGKDGWSGQNTGGTSGYYALAYYLMGEDGRGWGALNLNGKGPFGGKATAAYPSYYKVGSANSGAPDPILDAFKPGKAIFYYRYEPAENPPYNIQWNKGSGLIGDSSSTNFIDKDGFEILVMPTDAAANARRYVRQDYLLISPGADRYWGYVKEQQASSGGSGSTLVQVNTLTDVTSGIAMCDDVCNFKH